MAAQTTYRQFLSTAAMAATLLMTTPAEEVGAADEHVSNWECRSCPTADGWELDLEIGPAGLANDAYNFGDYTGLSDGGVYLFSDFVGQFRDSDSKYLFFEGYTRSEDSLALFVKGGKQSLYELRGSYQAIPRRLFNSTATPFIGVADLQLPAGWVRAPSTAGMAELQTSLIPVEVGRDWDIWQLGFDVTPGRNWQFTTDYTHRERSGNKYSSGSFFFDATEFVAPMQYSSDDLEIQLGYNAANWQTSISYFGSTFRNQYSSLSWANPYTNIAGADGGQLALAPDNESHQLSLAGSVLLPARTTLNGQISAGRLSQNDRLLPYTTNPALATPLPTATPDAEVETLNVNLRATSSPWKRITLEGELRYNDFDNKTPVNDYAYIVTDMFPANSTPSNTVYDYERSQLKLRGEYRLTRSTRLHAGFDTQRMERSNQDRQRTTTNRLWFRMRTQLGQSSNLDLDVFTEDRGGSTYSISDISTPENPLMRKYNMADRERTGLKLRGTIFTGGNSDLGWEFATGKDDYDDSAIGLTESEYVRLGADFSYAFSARGTAYASLYNEEVESEQTNSQSFSAPDWLASSDDNFTTATLGANWPDMIGKLEGNIELLWSRSKGEISNDTSGLPSSFPDLRTDRRNARIGLSYPYNDALSFGLDYIYERLSSDDWHLDGVEPATIPNLLALGADAWNYDASVLYFKLQYQLR